VEIVHTNNLKTLEKIFSGDWEPKILGPWLQNTAAAISKVSLRELQGNTTAGCSAVTSTYQCIFTSS